MRRVSKLVATAVIAAAALQPIPAAAHRPLPTGRYNCYDGAFQYVYYALRIDSRRAYSWSLNSGDSWRKGRYRHGSTKAISFKTGPLARSIVKKSVHERYSWGHRVYLLFRWNDGTEAEYYCDRS